MGVHCAHVYSPLQLALDYGIKFMETSAKANINVENVSPRFGRPSFRRFSLEDPKGLASGSGTPVKCCSEASAGHLLLGAQDSFSLAVSR